MLSLFQYLWSVLNMHLCCIYHRKCMYVAYTIDFQYWYGYWDAVYIDILSIAIKLWLRKKKLFDSNILRFLFIHFYYFNIVNLYLTIFSNMLKQYYYCELLVWMPRVSIKISIFNNVNQYFFEVFIDNMTLLANEEASNNLSFSYSTGLVLSVREQSVQKIAF